MAGWHHQLNGHEFEQAPGDDEGQGSLACCSPWGLKDSDMTERLNNSFPGGSAVKNLPIIRRHRFNLWVWKIPWRKKWQPAPVFLPGKVHGQRILGSYSP